MAAKTVTAINSCKHCKTASRFEYELDSLSLYRFDENGQRIAGWKDGKCPTCGARRKLSIVNGTYNEAKKCNANCRHATGGQCDCSCGGKSHGADWIELAKLLKLSA